MILERDLTKQELNTHGLFESCVVPMFLLGFIVKRGGSCVEKQRVDNYANRH